MKPSDSQIKELLYDSHVYFETETGLLCYTYGYHSRYDNENMVGCIVGYFTKNPTKRIQISTGRYVEKIMYEGNESNLDSDERFIHLPENVKKQLKYFTKTKKETNERLFVIPYAEVIKIYSPRGALKEVVEGKSNLDTRRIEAVLNLVRHFQKRDIAMEEIGLYGSLQIGVVHDSDVIDIDTILYGTHNYKKLLKITSEQKPEKNIVSKYRSINTVSAWKQARDVRDSCAKIYLTDKVHADVRIVRNRAERSSFNFQNIILDSENINLEGIVMYSPEALCSPSVFKILSNDIEYTVATRLYVFIGAVKQGDKVQIRGKKIKDYNSIIIANGKTDFILQL